MKEIQLSEKYKENFDVSSEDLTQFPRKRLRSKRRSSPCIFQVVVSLSFRGFFIITTTYTAINRKSVMHFTS
jgi:hypothetical protein